MNLKHLFGISTALLIGLLVSSRWHFSIAGTLKAQPTTPTKSAPKAIAPTPNPAPTLTYQLVTYQSHLLGMPRTYGLVLPPGYNQQPQRRYPVIFLLHGGHGDPTDWFKKGNALPVLEQLYANQKLPPAIIITPDGNDDRGSSPYWDPQYIDGPHGKVLSAIGRELVQEVASRYRTKPRPNFWAIGGLSSGGWGALNIGLHEPQNFSVLFSHSGYFSDRSGSENSPLAYVQTLSPAQQRQFRIYLDAGEGDKEYLTQSRQFHEMLDRLHMINTFHAFPGGHGTHGADVGWNYWHHHLADSLAYVGDRFQEAELIEQASHLPKK